MHDVPFQLITFHDGNQALDYLELLRITGMESCPDVLLLDLNLKSANSADVLKSFRMTAGAERPTLIVTSSSENCAIADSTRWFRQPFGFMEYMEIGRLAKDLQAAKQA